MPLIRVRPVMEEGIDNSEKQTAEDENFSRPTVFGYVAQRFANETTLHGFRNIFDTESSVFRRLLWLFVMLGCTGFCVQQFYQRVSRYISQPTSVDVDINYPNSLTFPKVVFCNYNIFNALYTSPNMYGITDTFIESKSNSDSAFIAQLNFIDELQIQQTGTPVNLTGYYYITRHTLKNMLRSCSFRGKTCGESDFRLINTDYGMCYQFVGDGGSMEVSSQGSGSGLTMTINVEQYAYMSNERDSAGILLTIQAQHEVPLMMSKGIAIPVGNQVLVALDLTKVQLIQQGENSCTTASLQYNKEYSTSACKQECLTKYVVDTCGCKEGSLPGNFSQSSAALLCNCLPACTESIYAPQTTLSPFSNHFMAREAEKLRNDRVFYDYIQGTDILESRINLKQTAADISALQRFGTHYTNYVNMAASIYPLMKQLCTAFSSVRLLSRSESTLPPQLTENMLSAEDLITELNNRMTSVDPSRFDYFFNYADDMSFYLIYNNIYHLGRRLTFNKFRFDSDNNQNASTFLWLQSNLLNISQDIVNSVNTAVQLINSTTQTTRRAEWGQLVSNMTTLLPQLSQAVASMKGTIQTLIEDGLKPMNAYISANVPTLSSVPHDGSLIRDNFLKLDVFFAEMRYTSIQKQISDNPVGLICKSLFINSPTTAVLGDLGGTFGLFLGASIMSLYEFVDFLLHLLGSHMKS